MKSIFVSLLLLSPVLITSCSDPNKSVATSDQAPSPANSSSLPMLDHLIVVDNHLQVYPDSEDSNKFYYLPGQLRFAQGENGIPLLSLMRVKVGNDVSYRVEMVLKVMVSKDQVESLTKWRKANENKTLVPITPKPTGYGNLHPEYYVELSLPPAPGRFEDEIAVSGVLTSTGYQAYKKRILGLETKSIGLQVCHEFDGLSDKIGIKREIDCRSVDFSGTGKYRDQVIID